MITIKPFKDIENFKFDNYLNHPYFDLQFIKSINFELKKEEDEFVNHIDSFEIQHWHRILFNKGHRMLRNFEYALFYFEKGINDEDYKIINGDGRIKFFPNFNDEDYTHQYNFHYFSEYFYMNCFAYLEIIAHIIYLQYDFKPSKKEKISFNNA